MGEIADMIVEGVLCQGCGVILDGEAPGYPRMCVDCGGETECMCDTDLIEEIETNE